MEGTCNDDVALERGVVEILLQLHLSVSALSSLSSKQLLIEYQWHSSEGDVFSCVLHGSPADGRP